jgi:hypothetical protein
MRRLIESITAPRILIPEHRHRQLSGRTEHFDLADVNFNGARRQVRVLGAGRTLAHLAVDTHHPFRAQLLGILERGRVGIGHHLGNAVMIAQVDEQKTAVIADAVAPAGQPDLLADVGFAQDAAGVGAVAMHDDERASMLSRGKAHARPRLSRTGKL